MKLLTKAIRKMLPPMRATENTPEDQKIAVVKFFNPMGRTTWYGIEFDGVDLFFGYAVSSLGPDCDEYGYFSLAELESIRLPMGLKIERDLYFKPQLLKPLIDKAQNDH